MLFGVIVKIDLQRQLEDIDICTYVISKAKWSFICNL